MAGLMKVSEVFAVVSKHSPAARMGEGQDIHIGNPLVSLTGLLRRKNVMA
jgi:hypothetical protein